MMCSGARLDLRRILLGNDAGEITSDVEGCFQWNINFFQQTLGSASDLESPSFTFCDKSYKLSLEMLKNNEVIMIQIRIPSEVRIMDKYYIELQLRTECNLVSDLHRIVTGNTNSNNLRFFIDFREFLTNGQPLSDRLTIILQLRKISENENLMDESHSMNRIQEDFKGLLACGENSDVKLIVCDKEFLAHRNILCARFSLFKKLMLHAIPLDGGAFDIIGCDPDTFEDFLTYVYTGSIRHINNENVISLYKIADSYDIGELKSACISFMRDNMSVDVFCSIAIFVLRYNGKELIEYSKRLFCKKAKEIFETENWLNFLLESPKEAKSLKSKRNLPQGIGKKKLKSHAQPFISLF